MGMYLLSWKLISTLTAEQLSHFLSPSLLNGAHHLKERICILPLSIDSLFEGLLPPKAANMKSRKLSSAPLQKYLKSWECTLFTTFAFTFQEQQHPLQQQNRQLQSLLQPPLFHLPPRHLPADLGQEKTYVNLNLIFDSTCPARDNFSAMTMQCNDKPGFLRKVSLNISLLFISLLFPISNTAGVQHSNLSI